jgi:hypothetical protein
MNDKEGFEIINETEKKYIQEIRDFEKYWYLGHRFQYNSFAGYTNAPFASKTLNISNLGFRGKEFTKKNLSGKKRVGLFGSSGLMGIPVSNDNNNISAYSNNYFQLNGLNYESINFGVISARVGNELKLITKILMEFEIDYVVLMSGFNDASSYTLGSLWEYQDILDIHETGFQVNKNLGNPIFFLKKFWKSINRKIEILKVKKISEEKFRGAEKYFRSKRAKRAKSIDNINTVPVYSEGEKIYINFLNQIISLCNFMNKPFLFLFQPSLFNTKKKLSMYELAAYKKQNNFFGEAEETRNYRLEQFKEFYNDFGNKCNKFVIDKGSKVINLDEKFLSVTENENIFYDESHYFETGNKIIGEEISKFISQDL